jgi:hypothetical protein
MKRRPTQADATRAPEAERAFLAGLLELLTDDTPRCREAAALVEPAALTIETGPELLVAIQAAAALEAPSLADVLRVARERAPDRDADTDPERVLLADLSKASASNRGGYARGVARHASTITKAAGRRRTIAAAHDAAAVAADPGAAPEEIEAAAAAVAEASADMPADRLEWVPFPADLLPDPVGPFVAEAAAALGADAAFVAMPLVASIAATIGNRRRIELWPGWQEAPVLWTATVAESGSMKSPAARKALGFVRERQRAAFADYRAAVAAWDQEKREHDATRRSRAADAEPLGERPTAERFVVNDCTVESLAPILEKNPGGLLVDRDELSGWFDFDRYSGGRGGGDVAHWLSLYDAGPVTVDRKLSGTIFVPSAAVSITGTIQPRVLARAVGSRHVENGLLQRFVLAAPPRRRKEIPSGDVSFATAADMGTMFSALFAIGWAADGGPRTLDLDADAADAWQRFYREHAEEQFSATGPVAAMLAKAEGWAARFALVCHLVRQAGPEPALGDRIDADSIHRGIGLARWAAREWRRVFHDMQHGTALEDDTALRRWIAARGGMATARDVARGLTKYRNPGAAEAALQRLARTGAAEWTAAETGGRPADAVRLK